MSDNEFFFDDDQKPEPAPKAKSASNGQAVKKSGPSGAVTKKPAPKSSPRPAAAPVRDVVEQQSVSLTIAVLIAVVALLVGMILGIFIGRAMVPEVVGTPVTATPSTMGTGGGTAPQLTEEQLAAGMPAGHGATTSTEPTTAP